MLYFFVSSQGYRCNLEQPEGNIGLAYQETEILGAIVMNNFEITKF